MTLRFKWFHKWILMLATLTLRGILKKLEDWLKFLTNIAWRVARPFPTSKSCNPTHSAKPKLVLKPEPNSTQSISFVLLNFH
ncbi:hypothetical protein RIR_jg2240.t1 [Rhizophagus irregularis DAOM 181602=DAOM 197198]|nr:hypothetical protein RIR_jg2240.t1 [Rhizophagus irregularis DAOM 181602=DAOM 197198]